MVRLVPLPERFRYFVPAFEAGPAPLYAHLAESAAAELAARPRGAFRRALAPFELEPVRWFLPLRLLAAVHRWVLAGEQPELAAHYPSAGGALAPEGAWPRFRDAVVARAEELPVLLASPLQHNEVTRAAALAPGFLLVGRETGMPLRLLEVGASAGLLLRWDHYLHSWWFPRMFDGEAPAVGGRVHVVERRGCDLSPIDATTAAGGLLLRSYVWADLADHVRILDEAIALTRVVPAFVDRADGADWLEELAHPRPGTATVVFHSLMRPSGPAESLDRMGEKLRRHAAAAMAEAPLAYLRFEAPDLDPPAGRARRLVEVRLTVWPGGEERLLATADVNGRNIRQQPALTTA
ncbi:MAG TPA: DUF2332 domain-containing protein [Candidatus Dormibacteraeota bacterium]|nr:DUF2332 domain-containing protein [Candidatus Dormibacteraeota bacterium]